MKKEICKKSINLFAPYSNEYLFDYIYLLGYTDKDLNTFYEYDKIKLETIEVLKSLFNLDVINVYMWCNGSEFNDKNLTIKETINHIDHLWFKGAKYPDFYNMVIFGTPKWYVEALEKKGMTHTTNWETFVKENIGDLEKWIEENRPKD